MSDEIGTHSTRVERRCPVRTSGRWTATRRRRRPTPSNATWGTSTGLIEIYERGGHLALGYGSWAEYCRAEFDVGQSRSYQLLDAGRVIRDIEAHSTNVESPPNEAVARELAKDPEPAEAWADVIEVNGDKPTAAQARAVVQERQLKDPATDKQVAYLRKLGHMSDGPISKRTASKRIEELQSHRYCTCSVCGQHWDRETRRGL